MADVDEQRVQRGRIISVRLSEAEAAEVERRAGEELISISAFGRRAMVSQARARKEMVDA